VTVSNAGDASLVIGNLFGLAAPFSIDSGNCSGRTLAPAATSRPRCVLHPPRPHRATTR
jgi:hypothetical protein